MTFVKARTIAGISAAASALAIAATPTAHADTASDALFLQQLANHNFSAMTGGQGLLTAGQSVCSALSAMPLTVDNARYEVGVIQANNRALTWDGAEWFVAISVVTLCPWNNLPPTTASSAQTTAT